MAGARVRPGHPLPASPLRFDCWRNAPSFVVANSFSPRYVSLYQPNRPECLRDGHAVAGLCLLPGHAGRSDRLFRSRQEQRTPFKRNRTSQSGQSRPSGKPKGIECIPGWIVGLTATCPRAWREKGSLRQGVSQTWESINQRLEPGYAFFQPITRYLPLPVQDFLLAGGWLIAGPGLAAFGWYGWRNRYRRPRSRPPGAK
jgi:hypothetical protein